MRCRSALAALAALALATGCTDDPAAASHPSLLLIVVDTLRADRLGLYGYARPTSPAIDALGRSGAVFEKALAASSWTVPSVASLLTGHVPSRHGAGRVVREHGEIVRRDGRKVFKRSDPALPTLAEQIRRAGHDTGAVVANVFLAPEMGLDRGFDLYRYLPRGPRAPVVVRAALEWLEAREGRPFFLMLHFIDPHLPYHAAPGTAGRFTREIGGGRLPVSNVRRIRERAATLSERERAFISAAYDEEIALVDAEISRLLRWLKRRGLLRDVLVILTSDHGEELFDHGGFEHGHTLYQELLHVPLIVAGPGVARRRIDAPVSLVDVAPTALEALGITPPPDLAGTSLWPLLTRGAPPPERSLLAEGTLYGLEKRALVRWPRKLIVDGRGTARIYDLDADRDERRPVAAAGSARALERELAERVAAAARARPETPDVQLSTPALEQLRALGYLEPQ